MSVFAAENRENARQARQKARNFSAKNFPFSVARMKGKIGTFH